MHFRCKTTPPWSFPRRALCRDRVSHANLTSTPSSSPTLATPLQLRRALPSPLLIFGRRWAHHWVHLIVHVPFCHSRAHLEVNTNLIPDPFFLSLFGQPPWQGSSRALCSPVRVARTLPPRPYAYVCTWVPALHVTPLAWRPHRGPATGARAAGCRRCPSAAGWNPASSHWSPTPVSTPTRSPRPPLSVQSLGWSNLVIHECSSVYVFLIIILQLKVVNSPKSAMIYLLLLIRTHSFLYSNSSSPTSSRPSCNPLPHDEGPTWGGSACKM
jgi:hypothetical protein